MQELTKGANMGKQAVGDLSFEVVEIGGVLRLRVSGPGVGFDTHAAAWELRRLAHYLEFAVKNHLKEGKERNLKNEYTN
jgi:hypothetical protein